MAELRRRSNEFRMRWKKRFLFHQGFTENLFDSTKSVKVVFACGYSNQLNECIQYHIIPKQEQELEHEIIESDEPYDTCKSIQGRFWWFDWSGSRVVCTWNLFVFFFKQRVLCRIEDGERGVIKLVLIESFTDVSGPDECWEHDDLTGRKTECKLHRQPSATWRSYLLLE